MSQDPNQPPQPQWDPQRGQWYIPGPQPQPAGSYGRGQQAMPPSDARYGQHPYGVPGHVPPPPPPPRKSRKWPWIVGGIVLLIVIIAVANSGGSTTPTTTAGGSAASTSSSASAQAPDVAGTTSGTASSGVVYKVTGSGRANNITYGDVTKGLSQANGQSLPWTKTTSASDGFAAYGLTAQNGGSGEITCSITVDGKEIASNSSSGQYAVVSCNGTSSPF